jgi:hypothetical protein
LGRIGEAADIADVVVFLAYGHARWITGTRSKPAAVSGSVPVADSARGANARGSAFLDNDGGGTKMHQVIARYKVKRDRAEENLELVRAVYDELERTKPAGLRYATFLLEDGVSFVHIARADADPNPLPQVAAFQEFQREIADRCEEQPQVSEVQEVGAYRF